MIRTEKITRDHRVYHFYYVNEAFLGTAERDESGFYNFYFAEENRGYWTAHALRLISDKLDELNREWNDYITKNLK